jgi:DNA-binding NtrC family response regulator
LELAPDARELLNVYHWPGNVRELENLVTRACVLNQKASISAAEIRPWLQAPEAVDDGAYSMQPAAGTLDDMERSMVVATLQRFGGNRARTAEALGIGVRTLSGKLRAYGYAPRTREFDRQNLPVAGAESADRATRRSA